MIKSTNTFDRTVRSLCAEIDALKEEVDFWREKYEQERNDYVKLSNDALADAQRGVANALMFAMAVTDNEQGDLVIKQGDRKSLAEQFAQ